VIAQNKDDIYIVDDRLGAYNGLQLLRGAINNGCIYAFILLTGQGYREMDIEAMKAGTVGLF
jgi:FixJ family two-component response regulator